jgi:hypothetical protein
MDYSSNVNYTSSSADPSAAAAGLVMLPLMLVYVGIIVLMVVSMWKLFVKAGKPGWGAIVPFYNTYLMVEIAGRPAWWFAVILLVPVVNIVFAIIVTIDFVKAYGKGTGFGVLSLFFPFVTFPIMAFDKATQYVRSVNTAAAPVAAPAPVIPAEQVQPAQQPQPPFGQQ